jgi:hypothetical protein
MHTLNASERRLLCDLVTYALENRSSAIVDLTQHSRGQLYVLYARLSGALEESEAQAQGTPSASSERFLRKLGTTESS